MSQPTSESAVRAALVGGAPVDHPEAGAAEALGKCYVLGHRHPFDEAEILVDEGDPPRPGACLVVGVGRAVEEHRAAVGAVDAAEDLDERRLSRAVFTEESDDLARADGEAHVLQRAGAAERLGNIAEFERRGSRQDLPPLAGVVGPWRRGGSTATLRAI